MRKIDLSRDSQPERVAYWMLRSQDSREKIEGGLFTLAYHSDSYPLFVALPKKKAAVQLFLLDEAEFSEDPLLKRENNDIVLNYPVSEFPGTPFILKGLSAKLKSMQVKEALYSLWRAADNLRDESLPFHTVNECGEFFYRVNNRLYK